MLFVTADLTLSFEEPHPTNLWNMWYRYLYEGLVRSLRCNVLRIEALYLMTRRSRHENAHVRMAEANRLTAFDITGISLSSIALLLTAF